jgi:hypothetical protein
MSAALNEIYDRLNDLISDQAARVRVVVETGYDEAGLVATTSGYLRLAQALVGFVLEAQTQGAQTWAINGASLPESGSIGSLFGLDEVRINSLTLAATEAQVGAVVTHFQDLSPHQD